MLLVASLRFELLLTCMTKKRFFYTGVELRGVVNLSKFYKYFSAFIIKLWLFEFYSHTYY